MIRFTCKYHYYPAADDLDKYIRHNVIDVQVFHDDHDWVLVGRLEVDDLDIAQAESDHWNIIHVCDADSAEWEHVYSTVIEPFADFAEIREDFGFDDPVNHLLFLRRAVFHPSIRTWQNYILDHVCNLFSFDSAMVMPRSETSLAEKELAALGFRKIVDSDLLFRPIMLASDYSASDDPRDPADLKIGPDAQEYVEIQWDNDDA